MSFHRRVLSFAQLISLKLTRPDLSIFSHTHKNECMQKRPKSLWLRAAMEPQTGGKKWGERRLQTRARTHHWHRQIKEKKAQNRSLEKRNSPSSKVTQKLLHRGPACPRLGPGGWNNYFPGDTLYTVLTFNWVCQRPGDRDTSPLGPRWCKAARHSALLSSWQFCSGADLSGNFCGGNADTLPLGSRRSGLHWGHSKFHSISTSFRHPRLFSQTGASAVFGLQPIKGSVKCRTTFLFLFLQPSLALWQHRDAGQRTRV